MTTELTHVEVCVDCYFAHHYGMHEHEGKWYAGESDVPCDQEPLAFLGDAPTYDATNSETGEGIENFRWTRCEGCGSTLGGARYRLAVDLRKEEAQR
jgi:hypothetical protein